MKRWFPRHPDYHLHFTPTGSSWLNQVERFFAEITEKRIRRGTFRSVPALERAIGEYLVEHNRNPRPFAWVADADSILDRVKKVCERTSDSGHLPRGSPPAVPPGRGTSAVCSHQHSSIQFCRRQLSSSPTAA